MNRATSLVWAIVVVGALFLFRFVTGWEDQNTLLFYGALSVLVIAVIFWISGRPTSESGAVMKNPSWARFLYENVKSAPLWLAVRLFLGTEWLASGLHKVFDPAWTGTGEALLGYWQRVVVIPDEGRPTITYDWYRDFIQGLIDAEAHTWFAKLVAYGEILVGLALIVGLFVGFAAFFGALMNMAFMLAGSASTNPILFTLAIFLILAWKVAGYWGLDGLLLPALGTPWQPGRLFNREDPDVQETSSIRE